MTKSNALSAREREVLSHIANGHTYVQTAHRMGIRACTVDTYLRRIRAKSGAVTGAELTRLAVALESGDAEMANGGQGR
jgi:DNA-binding CsgD family transcriptional regulator